jgi:hypothetical protein
MMKPAVTCWLGARARGLSWAARNTLSRIGRLFEPGCMAIGRHLALRRNRRKTFRHDLAVCAIFRDEAIFLDEWLTMHRVVGVGHFYLYNHRSGDNCREVLAPWIRRGLVTLYDWPEEGSQTGAYNHCIRRHRMDARWIAFIDLDEFLFSPEQRDLPAVLARYADVPAVLVYWVMFGSNGHRTRPAAPVIESYTRCLSIEGASKAPYGWPKEGKCIVNPRLVKKYDVHIPRQTWVGETVDENFRPPRQRTAEPVEISCSALRINHYFVKSLEDLERKKSRGNWHWKRSPEELLARWKWMDEHLNATEDRVLLEMWRAAHGAPPAFGHGPRRGWLRRKAAA